jgi:hypothetical protein
MAIRLTSLVNYFVFLCFRKQFSCSVILRFLLVIVLNTADQRDVVSLEHDSADVCSLCSGLRLVLLDEHLLCLIEDTIHVLIKADDLSFDSQLRVVIDPDLNPTFCLEELVDHEL